MPVRRAHFSFAPPVPPSMAWSPPSPPSNDTLVDSLIANKLVSPSSRVEAALRAVDRAYFCPTAPYVDAPQPLIANATISAPHMHAKALSLMTHVLRPGAAVLDVGAGSGYLTACMAAMVAVRNPNAAAGTFAANDVDVAAVGSTLPGMPVAGGATVEAAVVAVEHIPELVSASVESLSTALPEEQMAVVRVLEGDGRLGAPAYAPFDAIHVGAAAEEVPRALVDQLARGGRLVCPVGPAGGDQFLTVVDRLPDGSIETTRALAVRYVPLCSREDQIKGYR